MTQTFPIDQAALADLGATHGHVVGFLEPAEDRSALTTALLQAHDWLSAGKVQLLLHGQLRGDAPADLAQQREARLGALRAGRLKRYVFRIETSVGPRIIKMAEVVTTGNALVGLLGGSAGRREHTNHRRAQTMGLAVTETCGFLEWRLGPRLLRSCQVQTCLPPEVPTLDAFLAEELHRHGDAALHSLGEAMAHMHNQRFFHADVKGFHAFPADVVRVGEGPASYKLRWLDLGRVAFWMSRRKRIINLYQVFRFVLPPRSSAEEAFMRAYCAASGWYRGEPERALWAVRRFLAYKLRHHPAPDI